MKSLELITFIFGFKPKPDNLLTQYCFLHCDWLPWARTHWPVALAT